MDTIQLILILFGSFVALALIGVPIAVSLGLAGFLSALAAGINPIAIVQNIYAILNSYTLLAVPLFMLVGSLMEHGEITERLVGFSRVLVGHIRGGLGQVNVLTNMLMSGISGSATADAAALGSVMLPAMKREGYPADLAAAINATASTLGPIIPPSIMMVVYGAYGGVSIGAMFLGGFLPGALLGVALMIYIYVWARRTGFNAHLKRATAREVWEATKDAALALLAPVIIVASIVSGLCTTTEAGMICAVYCLLVCLISYRSLSFHSMIIVLKDTLSGTGKPLLCVAGAGAFGYMMAYLQIPNRVLELFGPYADSKVSVTLFIVILYLILGTFMDATPAIVIFISIIQSLAENVGLNQLHVGVLVCVTLCCGFITPPYGLTLLISAGLANVSTTAVIKRLAPQLILYIFIILLIAFIPEIVLWLPRIFMPSSV